MKVKIVGKEVVSYFSQKKNQQVEGLSLYFNADKDGVQGQFVDNVWVDKKAPLYSRLLGLDVSKPISADIQYEMIPGSRYPQVVDIVAV